MCMTKGILAQAKADAYSEAGVEPSLAEVMAEPIVRAVMRRDSVSEETLIGVITRARARLLGSDVAA